MAPQVVFEILSPSHRFGDSVRKFRFYDEHGVEEFYVYDPDSGGLEGWRRANTGLEAIEEMYGYESPRLKVKFEPGEGMDNLKIIGPDGTPFATYVELYEAAVRRRIREAADQRGVEPSAWLRGFESLDWTRNELFGSCRWLAVEHSQRKNAFTSSQLT